MFGIYGKHGVAGGPAPMQRRNGNPAGPLAGGRSGGDLPGVAPPWVQPRRITAGQAMQPPAQRRPHAAPGARSPARPFDPRNPRAHLPPRHQPPFAVHGQRPVVRVPAPNNGMGHRLAREIERVVGELGLAPEPVLQRLTREVNGFNGAVQLASLGIIPPGGWLGRLIGPK